MRDGVYLPLNRLYKGEDAVPEAAAAAAGVVLMQQRRIFSQQKRS